MTNLGARLRDGLRASIMPPQPLPNQGWEVEFQQAYRDGAAAGAGSAAVGAAGIYLALLALVWFTEPHQELVLWIRFVIAMLLLLAGWHLSSSSRRFQEFDSTVIGFASTLALLGIVVLFVVPHADSDAPVVLASPAFIFALFVHYSLLRLRVWVASVIGWGTSSLAFFYVPMVVGGNTAMRSLLFLVCANLMGVRILALIESRERELYRQRRIADEARSEANMRREAAEEATREKTQLIAAVSHDLRQPMTAAVAHLEVLHRHLAAGDPGAAREHLLLVRRSVETLGDTLDHLLTAARYDSGTEALRIELVDLAALLQDVHSAYAVDALQRGVALRLRLPSERVLLATDARSLRRVLSNLVANAIKFTDPRPDARGGVLVAARLRDRLCRIDVIDTGIGIAPDQHESVWKPYVQLDNVARDRARGLGLGLFLVRRIVQQLPGHGVSMRSVPGRGSWFTVTVPANRLSTAFPGDVTPPELAPERPSLDALGGAYVLLLEDDREARHSLTVLMTHWGVLVDAAATVGDLLDAARQSERMVDAIVCDYRLGAGTLGTDAIAILRDRLGYSPPAVLISGEADVARLRSIAGPATVVLHKPFAADSLARPLLDAVRTMRAAEDGSPPHFGDAGDDRPDSV